MSLEIKIINQSRNPLPEHKTSGSAGMDLQAWIEKDVILHPMQRELIPTGLFIEIPEGYEAQVRPRSGLALKNGITVLNSPGTVDSDYRGELKVLLINLSREPFTVSSGDRIAQLVIAAHETVAWTISEGLSKSERGSGSYGSTGIL